MSVPVNIIDPLIMKSAEGKKVTKKMKKVKKKRKPSKSPLRPHFMQHTQNSEFLKQGTRSQCSEVI